MAQLNDYHLKKSKAAQEAVNEMKKRPLSLQDCKAQIERLHQQRMNPAKTLLPLLMLTSVLLMQVLTSCNDRETEQQEQVIESPVEVQMTWAEIDSLYNVAVDALSRQYEAIVIEDVFFSYTYQYQSYFDTTALFALEGVVVDVFRRDNQMILIVKVYNLGKEIFFQTSMPMEMFEARKTDFEHKHKHGMFIVNVKNTISTIIRHADSEVTDYDISDSGELDYAEISHSYRHKPTLFLHGELVDFYLYQKR